jgi:hypothetical protein
LKYKPAGNLPQGKVRKAFGHYLQKTKPRTWEGRN